MYPRASYIIYATQRTGSFLLCEALRKTQVAGKPSEYLTPVIAHSYSKHWGVPLRDASTLQLGEDYFQRMYATATPNGMFGVKIQWDIFPYCLKQIRTLQGNEHLSIMDLLQTAFPQHRSIMITRRDKVRQAISWWKAIQTRQWLKKSDKPDGEIPQNLDFNFGVIECCRQVQIDYERRMQLYFLACDIQPFTVVYEDFVNNYEETTFQILDYLHLPVPKDLELGKPQIQKQADELTEEWVQRYYQMKQEREMASNKTLLDILEVDANNLSDLFAVFS